MKLNYNIIWFEDDNNAYDNMSREINEFLEELAFTPKFQRETSDNNLDKLIERKYIDLIVIDYKLARNKKGDEIIKKIRKNDIYTEIIFYSQDPIQPLLDALIGTDGIFYSSRSDVVNKIKRVIKLTLRKIEDPNNMRGLVMAEVSNIDKKMIDIIQSHLGKIPSKDANDLAKKIQDKIIKSLEDKKKEILDYQVENEITDLLYSYHFDSSLKWRSVKNISENLKKEKLVEALVNCLNEYDKEVLQVRNLLAHVTEETDEKGNLILKGKKGFIFNDSACIDIRKKIRKHSDAFCKLHDYIEKK